MKKIICIMLTMFLFCQTAYADTEIRTNEPQVKALGAILVDCKSGRILFGKNEQTPLPMASTTKIMTAIFAIENGDLTDTVKISKRSSRAPETKLFLSEGEEVKLEYLLHALMLQSANDAAIAIAEHISGSVEEFCKQMTQKAKEIGAMDTLFLTPNGLDDGNHHSTAYDMAMITRYALKNPTFCKIIKTPNLSFESNKKSYSIINKNRLLNEYDGSIGVKTGFTGKAGQCFVGAAKRGDMQLISVVLGSGWGPSGKEQKWIDTKALLNYGFDNFSYKNIVDSGRYASYVNVDHSKTSQINLLFADGYELPLKEEEISKVKILLTPPVSKCAPIKKGEVLGKAKITIDGKPLKEIALVAENAATRHDLKTSLEKVLDEFLGMGTNSKVDIKLPEF